MSDIGGVSRSEFLSWKRSGVADWFFEQINEKLLLEKVHLSSGGTVTSGDIAKTAMDTAEKTAFIRGLRWVLDFEPSQDVSRDDGE